MWSYVANANALVFSSLIDSLASLQTTKQPCAANMFCKMNYTCKISRIGSGKMIRMMQNHPLKRMMHKQKVIMVGTYKVVKHIINAYRFHSKMLQVG